MDAIVGDFTLTSKTARIPPNAEYENPAIISTTFPRAIKQNEGYEITLKSIAHAPLKNLVRNEFDLITMTFTEVTWRSNSKTFHLPFRFYESQADLLMEIYRILGALDDPPSMILYAKDGETTLKFTSFDSIDIRSDIFLNRPFKYKSYRDSGMKTVSRKRRALEHDDSPPSKKTTSTAASSDPNDILKFNNRKEKGDRIRDLEKAVEHLDRAWAPLQDYYSTVDLNDITNAYRLWKTQYLVWQSDKIQHEKTLLENNKKIKDFEEKLDTLPSLRDVDKEKTQKELDEIRSSINKIIVLANELQEDQDHVLQRLEMKIDQSHQVMAEMINVLTKQLGHDSSQLIATDTSNFVSTKDKDIVRAQEITVSSEPIVTTRLGFLYCNVIENSLINNKESRLLCIFPIVSKRGYSFYEVKEAIYKPISVLQFSTITFTIVDSEGELVDFSLEGDQLTNKGDRKKKYPTLLNLHVRKRL